MSGDADNHPYLRGEKWFGISSPDTTSTSTTACTPFLTRQSARQALDTASAAQSRLPIYLYTWQLRRLQAIIDLEHHGDYIAFALKASHQTLLIVTEWVWPLMKPANADGENDGDRATTAGGKMECWTAEEMVFLGMLTREVCLDPLMLIAQLREGAASEKNGGDKVGVARFPDPEDVGQGVGDERLQRASVSGQQEGASRKGKGKANMIDGNA